ATIPLAKGDFSLSITGGTAILLDDDDDDDNEIKPNDIKNISGGNVAAGDNVFLLYFEVDGTANGEEVITVLPANNQSIYDVAGNRATIEAQTTNTTTLNDLTPPVLTIVEDIEGNSVGGVKYVNVRRPTLTLKADDLSDSEMTLTCFVEDEEGNTLERPLDPNTVDHNEDTEVTINSDLIDGDYIVTIRARDAALNQVEVIIENFTIDATPPEITSIEIDPSNSPDPANKNQKIIITFDTPVYSISDGTGNSLNNLNDLPHFPLTNGATGVALVGNIPTDITHPYNWPIDNDLSKVG
ncbi:uncharacterized protein METZ01_LOCUS379950, partial [marine metagenome]